MSKSSKAKSALPYVQRLVEDQYVQEQLRDAAVGLRSAYTRISREREQAAEDKKLYGNLRRAATSIRNAKMALQKPEPPPKRRMRKVLIIALAAAGTGLLVRFASHQQASPIASGPDGAGNVGTSPVNESAQAQTVTTNP